MSFSCINYHELPMMSPQKGAFYWLIPGKMNYELMHEELLQDRVSHWFLPNLDPSFEEHCTVSWAGVERDRIDCAKCGRGDGWVVTTAKAQSLSGYSNEVMDIDSEVGISIAVSEFLARQKISGSVFVTVEDIDCQEDAAIWSAHKFVRSGTRFSIKSACNSCGNDVLLCPDCYKFLLVCPGCGKCRRYHSDSHRRNLITLSLRNWNMDNCFYVKNGILVLSGQTMKLVLEQRLFGFMFGEVLTETFGASYEKLESAIHTSVELAELLSMVPGGSKNNAEIMKGII